MLLNVNPEEFIKALKDCEEVKHDKLLLMYNLTKNIQDIVKREKEKKMTRFEHLNYSVKSSLPELSMMFSLVGCVYMFVMSMPYNQVDWETSLGYGNDSLSCILD